MYLHNAVPRFLVGLLLMVTVPVLVSKIARGADRQLSAQLFAMVGGAGITGSDLSFRMAVERAYGSRRVSTEAALISLVNEALEAEVARGFGLAATPEEIAALTKHANETTKAPEILAAVKRAFGGDHAAYTRIYLVPHIINRKLRTWYSRNAEIHERERAIIEKAYHLAWSGKSLEQAAQACGLYFSTIDYGKADKALPPLLKKYFPQGGGSLDVPMRAILETLSEGEIYQNIVEDDYGYKVIKLVRKDGLQYTAEVITAKKHPFTKWFREQAAKVPVKMLDAELEKKIVSKYPNVWWVREWCKKGGSVGK